LRVERIRTRVLHGPWRAAIRTEAILKPLERLGRARVALHRAKAAVLMEEGWPARRRGTEDEHNS
jgi:hypothetical protein